MNSSLLWNNVNFALDGDVHNSRATATQYTVEFQEGRKVIIWYGNLQSWEAVVTAVTTMKVIYSRVGGDNSNNCFLVQPVPGSKLQTLRQWQVLKR